MSNIADLEAHIADLEAENQWLRLSVEEQRLIRQMLDRKRVSGLTKAEDDFARRQLCDRGLVVGIAVTPSFTALGLILADWLKKAEGKVAP